MKEFKVNDYITLKLDDGRTSIYVNNELFNQCKILMINISIDKISDYDEVLSIDEAAELPDGSMEGRDRELLEITSEAEFWAHCSNLQVWAEYNYDTRLLHSSLSFPLLKKLTEVGDQYAKSVFREEIAKRLESGYWPVIEFLTQEGYIEYLNREDYFYCILGADEQAEKEVKFLLEIEKLIGVNLDLERKLETEDGKDFKIENNRIVGISIGGYELKIIPESIGQLKYLKEIYFCYNIIQELPSSIGNLENLEVLDLSGNKIEFLPISIRKLKSLKVLILRNNNLKEITDSFGNLKSLEVLNLKGNQLNTLPNSIGNLINLRKLNLRDNAIANMPENIESLKNLEILDVSLNDFKEIPEAVYNISSLKILDIYKNKIEILPPEIKILTSLKELDLGYNKLKTLPKSICELKSLETLNLYKNELEDLPFGIINLNQLKELDIRKNPRIMLSNEIKNKLKKILLSD